MSDLLFDAVFKQREVVFLQSANCSGCFLLHNQCVDRYQVNGGYRQVMLATRELDRDRLVQFRAPTTLPGRWRFVQFEPTPQHRGALAIECNGNDVRVVFRDWCSVYV